ncbi:hypothetical protein Q8A64_02480 [Oxalobacteraceae bacterium R-40]|uniref:Uncharacterized protein n=1 Tax=Keguizhuia sedimenti TaxID=3064264 RepID=A0ABU1BJT9_9BURK|nr:hypothetical protein [Oxalobacteraceae bacterium R-40]
MNIVQRDAVAQQGFFEETKNSRMRMMQLCHQCGYGVGILWNARGRMFANECLKNQVEQVPLYLK